MKSVYVVIASNNTLENIHRFKNSLAQNDCEIKVIDEGNENLRTKNREILAGLDFEFYGPKERENWFKQRFGSSYAKYVSVIPEKCHAETSFGFLIAYEKQPDLVVELDDDVLPVQGYDLMENHVGSLFHDDGVTVDSTSKWYNTLENMKLNVDSPIFPRGHPFALETRKENYEWTDLGGRCVLNMGLWTGNLDLDALTILYYGGLNGKCDVTSDSCKRPKVIVGKGAYSAVCSMNASFATQIIPAFYQLYMNCMGVDRFDDIWSGIFLKTIADHLGHKTCLGKPLVQHDKRPRNVFGDLRKELDGIIINESLWKIFDPLSIEGETYWGSYNSLIYNLEKKLPEVANQLHRKFLEIQTSKMSLWLKILDKIA